MWLPLIQKNIMEQGKRKEQYETSAKIAFGGCIGIISILVFCILMVIGQEVLGQSVYVTKYAHQADLLVYVTPYAHQADKKVCKVKYRYKANPDKNHWYFCEYPYQADMKICFVKYKWMADMRIHYVRRVWETR